MTLISDYKEYRREEHMRLDKYLKVSRLIKRRTVANEACDAGRVLVNEDRRYHRNSVRKQECKSGSSGCERNCEKRRRREYV